MPGVDWYDSSLLESIFGLLRTVIASAIIGAGVYGLIFRLKGNPE